ncbi:redox-regulated ATPase YchF [bacterium]|nr:redox-regulated ATPase YchF [bacterium]
MTWSAGIIGLPNVGKTTIFNALTGARAEASLYPFCTIEPNRAIVSYIDQRLRDLVRLLEPEHWSGASITFLDVAGLVRGAAQGEGLGNQFLGHVRTTDVLVHVVRCFPNPKVAHVSGKLEPVKDIELINTELILADLDVLERRAIKVRKQQRSGDKTVDDAIKLIERIDLALKTDQPARNVPLFNEDERTLMQSFDLLTARPMIYCANIGETDTDEHMALLEKIKTKAGDDGAECVSLCGDLEAGLVELEPAEQELFRQEYGLTVSGLDQLISTVIKHLNLSLFYTITGAEMRSWLIPANTPAPQAAGHIHSDMERGFIKAEVLAFGDLIAAGSWSRAKEQGGIRIEGKNYLVRDGDIILFRFQA